MWVLSFNDYYWSMCETMNGKYKDYHINRKEKYIQEEKKKG